MFGDVCFLPESLLLNFRFRDESEVVVVLEKLKSEETVETSNFNAAFGSKPNSKATFWPSLVQSLPSLSRGLSSLLQSCSVNIVGGDSEANWAVAKALATSMECVTILFLHRSLF